MTEEDDNSDNIFIPIECPENMSDIGFGLFLGNVQGASDLNLLQQNSITHVLTMGRDKPSSHFSSMIKYKQVEIMYSPAEMVIDYFKESFEFIQQALDKKGNVFVHCGRGISRSSAVVIGFLMMTNGWTFAEAFQYTSSKRTCTFPNVGFQLQLQLLEKQLADKVTLFENPEFDINAELDQAIQMQLQDIEEMMDRMVDSDPTLLEDAEPWRMLGFFFENIRHHLRIVDIGTTPETLNRAKDISRRLTNMSMLFEGAAVEMAVRVAKSITGWADTCAFTSAADRRAAIQDDTNGLGPAPKKLKTSPLVDQDQEPARAAAAQDQQKESAAIADLSVKELKTRLTALGVDFAGFVEKADFVEALERASSAPPVPS